MDLRVTVIAGLVDGPPKYFFPCLHIDQGLGL